MRSLLVTVMMMVTLLVPTWAKEVDTVVNVKPGEVNGTLLTAKGEPIKNTTIEFVDAEGNVVATAKTSETGAYTVNLPAGTYDLVVGGSKLAAVAVTTAATSSTLPIVASTAGILGAVGTTGVVVGGVVLAGVAVGAAVAADNNSGGGDDDTVSP